MLRLGKNCTGTRPADLQCTWKTNESTVKSALKSVAAESGLNPLL